MAAAIDGHEVWGVRVIIEMNISEVVNHSIVSSDQSVSRYGNVSMS